MRRSRKCQDERLLGWSVLVLKRNSTCFALHWPLSKHSSVGHFFFHHQEPHAAPSWKNLHTKLIFLKEMLSPVASVEKGGSTSSAWLVAKDGHEVEFFIRLMRGGSF